MDTGLAQRSPWSLGRHVPGKRRTLYSRRRFGAGPKKTEIAFLRGWYKFEVPWPLKRPTQTGLGPSARTPTDCGTWGFGKGLVSSDHLARRLALGTPRAAQALG